VELSQAQDIEAGDGTTSVVVLAGSLLGAAEKLLSQGELTDLRICPGSTELITLGIHPTTIAHSFQKAASKAVELLNDISVPIDMNDRESLMRAASTSLNSKVS
jgi:T-complex protein 1 subunit delta